MSTEENFFLTEVYQSNKTPIDFVVPSNECVIRIIHVQITGTFWDDVKIEYNDICTLADFQVIVELPEFLLFSERFKHIAQIVEVLTRMKVPINEQPPIIDKLFIEIERAGNPQCAIACVIKDLTLFHQTVKRSYRSECFEEVGIDSLEDTDKQIQCSICRENLDHIEDIDEGIDCRNLVRLPCSHLYHGDCLSKWLPISELCPLCRYSLPVEKQSMPVVEESMPVVEEAMPVVEEAMPVVEELMPGEQTIPDVEQTMPVVEQAAEPSWPRLHWPVLLTASAGGILTAILVCKLLKQTLV